MRHDADALMAELRKTNRLLQTLILAGIGFALGMGGALFMLVRLRIF